MLERIAEHPINRVDELLPWNLASQIKPAEQTRREDRTLPVGTLIDFDQDAVFLRPHGGRLSEDQMIFKLAISTIESDAPIGVRNSPDDLGGLLSRSRRLGRT